MKDIVLKYPATASVPVLADHLTSIGKAPAPRPSIHLDLSDPTHKTVSTILLTRGIPFNDDSASGGEDVQYDDPTAPVSEGT